MSDPTPQATPSPDRAAEFEGAPEWKSHPFMEGLSSEHLATLAEYAMSTSFNAAQVIFREGEIANRFYLILEGCVALETETPDRPALPVASITAGDVLGWSWLFPPYTWNFTARAVGPVKAMFFYGSWLREAVEKNHDLGYELTKRMAQIVIERMQSTRRRLELETKH